MRILFILEYFYPHTGGVETLFKSLVEELDRQGHQVTILTNRYDDELPFEECIGTSGRIIRHRYGSRYGFTFLAACRAIQLARSADIIHTTSYNAAIPGWIAAKYTKTTSVITFHERYGSLWYRLPWMGKMSAWLHATFERLIIGLDFNAFVAVSESTKVSLLDGGVAGDRVHRIYNGIDYHTIRVPQIERNEKDVFRFLYFGRVGYAKGLDILLGAYAHILDEEGDHRLSLIIPSEPTPLLDQVMRLIKKYQIAHRIDILHDLSLEDLTLHIAKSDAVVIPSYSEGFCYAAVETMAIGTPIVSSGQGALAEVISGKHITVASHDIEAFSAAMRSALAGAWSISPLRKFPLSATIAGYLDLYRLLLDSKP